jgi:O-antigen ligase
VQGTLIVAGVGVAIIGLLPVVGQTIVSTGTREGQGLDTLSGRTIAFSYLVEQWRESPLIGHGYAAGTRNALLEFVVRERINIGAGHDALSTVLVDLGLVGLAVLAASLVVAWMSLARLALSVGSDRRASIAVHQVTCVLVWVTIQTFVSTSLAGPNQVFVVAIVSLWTLSGRRRAVDRDAVLAAGRLGR